MFTSPTRGNKILDLIFANNAEFIHSVQVSPTVISVHNMIQLFLYYSERSAHKHGRNDMKYDTPFRSIHFRKTNWKEIETETFTTY